MDSLVTSSLKFPFQNRAWIHSRRICIVCRDSKGFGSKEPKKKDTSKVKPQQFPQQAKPLEYTLGEQGVSERNDDVLFEQRLEAIRSSGMEKKKTQEESLYGPINYNAPPKDEKKNNLAVKIVAGLAVLGLIVSFAIGDFLPTASKNVRNESVTGSKTFTPEEEKKLQTEANKFEEILASSPDDAPALEGAAVVYAELGEYTKAKTNLEKLTQLAPDNVEALRLLAEVKSSLKDYEGSAITYKEALKASGSRPVELVTGLTQALLDAKKPGEAVDELLRIKGKLNGVPQDKNSEQGETAPQMDAVQLDLLLGRAYYAWDRVGDALTVYDSVIKNNANDFRGYLAKAVLLKEQGNAGDAERMFIQARYFAPDKAKSLVDKYRQ